MVSRTSIRRGLQVLGIRGLAIAGSQKLLWRGSAPALGIREIVTGARVLEVGGPSEIFRPHGLVALYGMPDSIDNVNFANETIWEHGLADGGDYAPEGERLGTQYLREATDLKIRGSYDVVASSHTIEHTANPLRALAEYRKVTRPGGHLILVVPHLDGTVDHRRPITSLEHLIEDERNNTPESDATHWREAIELSDPARMDGMTVEEWSNRIYDNINRRSCHHHVFSTWSALEMVRQGGWSPVSASAFWPYDIVVIASNDTRVQDVKVRSPFPTDRKRRPSDRRRV